MTQFFLGADVGATKTHILITNEDGQTVGFGESGAGNHEIVGYEGLSRALIEATQQAMSRAKIIKTQICGAGFGIGGYDWPSERKKTLQAIGELELTCPVEAVNDTLLGVLAGTPAGWGLAVVAGTGCNCWGRDKTYQRLGMVTGGGRVFGEGAGSSELIERVIQILAYEWTGRGPSTRLTPAMVALAGARDLIDLLDGLSNDHYQLDASAAPLVFQVAEGGDPVASQLIRWAGNELGELANTVIRQLNFESLQFDVVLIGSMFDGGPPLIEPMKQKIHSIAPMANLVRLSAPPVIGAVVLGMEQAGISPTAEVRENLAHSSRLALQTIRTRP